MRRRRLAYRSSIRARSTQLRKPRFLVLLTGILALFGLTFLAGAIFWFQLPDVSVLKTSYPVVIPAQKKGEPATIRLQKSRPGSWVSLGAISNRAVGAIVVSEDWAFYNHEGFDTNQIIEAAKEDFEKGRFARGASTITQQVARNVFLEKEKTLWRKLKELLLAVRLENELSKRRILEIYLNIAEWGDGFYGIGPAAGRYFSKSPAELTAKEGAFLAMLLPSPKRYSQSVRKRQLTPYARKTVDSILDKMVQARYLPAEDRDEEKSRALSFEDTPDNSPEGTSEAISEETEEPDSST